MRSVNTNDLNELNLPDCGSDASVSGDHAILESFYEATGGGGWTDADVRADWLSDKPIGDWRGVRAEDGRVTGLSLARLGLSGEVPASLAQLTELSHLDLSWNSLTGDLPASLGGLRNIDVLLIAGNNLSGCVPGSLRDAQVSDVVFTAIYYCDDDGYDAGGMNMKPMPEWPGLVKWHVGDSVWESEERAARLGVQWLHQYARDNGWHSTRGAEGVYVDRTLPLIGACTQRYPLLVLKCADLRNIAGFANIETNFINASEPDASPSIGMLYGMAGTAIHENIHTSFQHQLRGYNADPSPVWFTEGMATYFAAVIADSNLPYKALSGSSWFEHLRSGWVQGALGAGDTLSGAETETGCAYGCGPLAIELLASEVGLRKIADFHLALRRTVLEFFTQTVPESVLVWTGDPDAWHAPFQEIFGMTVNEFYDMYRAHKANGFEFEAPDEAPYIPEDD